MPRANLKKSSSRKQSAPKFPKNEHFLLPGMHTYLCVSGGKKCLFFGKFGVLRFLETTVLRFALFSYYRRMEDTFLKRFTEFKLFKYNCSGNNKLLAFFDIKLQNKKYLLCIYMKFCSHFFSLHSCQKCLCQVKVFPFNITAKVVAGNQVSLLAAWVFGTMLIVDVHPQIHHYSVNNQLHLIYNQQSNTVSI